MWFICLPIFWNNIILPLMDAHLQRHCMGLPFTCIAFCIEIACFISAWFITEHENAPVWLWFHLQEDACDAQNMPPWIEKSNSFMHLCILCAICVLLSPWCWCCHWICQSVLSIVKTVLFLLWEIFLGLYWFLPWCMRQIWFCVVQSPPLNVHSQ